MWLFSGLSGIQIVRVVAIDQLHNTQQLIFGVGGGLDGGIIFQNRT